MFNNIKYCKQNGHTSKMIEYVCLHYKCQQKTRWLCQECFQTNSHESDPSYNEELICDRLKFRARVEKFIRNFNSYKYDEQIEKLITQVQRLQAQINMFLHKVFEIKQAIQRDKERFDEFQEELKKGSFFQFDEKQIERLTLIPNFIKQSKSLTTSKTHDVEENFQCSQELPQLVDQIRLKKYEINQIEELKEGQSIYASQISPDEKFLVSGGSDCILKIWDLNSLKQLRRFQLASWIRQIQFTNNSRYLGIGDYEGRLIIIDLTQNYRKIFDLLLHTKQINDICFVNDNEVITCSTDNTIIKTYIKQKLVIYKIEPHTDSIRSVDYDPVEDVFVSGSDDASIKLFDGNDGTMLLEKVDPNQHYIFQVQIMSNLNKVLSLDINDKLKIWIIDYPGKTLKLQQIIDESIYNFSIVLEQQFLLLICEQYVKFYTIDGSLVRQIDHCLPEICINYLNIKEDMYQQRQVDSMRCIVVKGISKLLSIQKNFKS
ncbi:G protein subunit beta [Paramecium bursaria]